MDVSKFNKLSIRNKEELKNHKNCSCYFCLKVFKTTEVKEFTEELDGSETAICPFCGIDSLVPGEVSKEILKSAQKFWFEWGNVKELKTIPFGKFKGQDFKILENPHNKNYVEWLYTNCENSLTKFPDFHIFIQELMGVVEKNLPYTDFCNVPTLDSIDTNGVLIKDWNDYRKIISKIYQWEYIKIKQEHAYKTFGEPFKYPFVLTLRKNTMDEFNSVSFHKIYIEEVPSFYTFRSSYYEWNNILQKV